jgi:hypothetical protein
VSSLPDYKDTFPKWRPRNLAESVPDLEPAGVDLLSRMLVYTPQHRITARAAMQVWGVMSAEVSIIMQAYRFYALHESSPLILRSTSTLMTSHSY